MTAPTTRNYGYGHRRLPNENLSYGMTEAEAEALLRKDLAVRYRLFRKYGKDALLLSEISDKSSYPNQNIIPT